eukprot:TRINITY_DN1923_c0_g1_i6.p1 TRINITY_DN1923_c0_g1~~TRINITY_DN1923_c0_g1_i6.p1  ORF type:complete len:276 (+),score=20.26 TRINITY_DN1923_c0_g1_i6:5-832(+)
MGVIHHRSTLASATAFFGTRPSSPPLPFSSSADTLSPLSTPSSSPRAMAVPLWPAVLAHVFGVCAFAVALLWSLHYRGGLAWYSPVPMIFNWHPILMVGGFIVLSGEAILVYRILPGSKPFRKLVHLSIHAVALILAIVGVISAFRFHDLSTPPIDNLYSLHSWLGITTVVFFGLQWIAGFVSFWYPGVQTSLRASYLPWHVFWGMTIFLLGVATSLLGVLEKLTFLQTGSVISRFSSEAMWANTLGFLIVAFAISVVAVGIRNDRQRDDYRVLD